MQTRYERIFLKDIRRLRDKAVVKKLKEILIEFEHTKTIKMHNLKKFKGFDVYYRLRIGDYRLGLRCENDEVVMIRFVHRKDIYRSFPQL